MEWSTRKHLISLMGLIAFFALSHQAQARTWYNLPTYSKVKIQRNPKGQSWIYLEFMWGEKGLPDEQQKCKPNFEKGKAVEFEIGITPKCFLRPKGGKDHLFKCKDALGDLGVDYNLPDNFIPEINATNCYVDLWNYWNPSPDDVVSELHSACGLDSSDDWCAKTATATGAFLDPIGNFAVGLHDASALKAGVRYSFRYPVEINDSPECRTVPFSFDKNSAKQCLVDKSTYLSEFLSKLQPTRCNRGIKRRTGRKPARRLHRHTAVNHAPIHNHQQSL
jgi:hypothetical protein